MNREAVLKVIHESVDELNAQFAPPSPLGKEPETVLCGDGGGLDSLGFVNFVSILEEKCEEVLGLSVSLTEIPGAGDGLDPLRSIGALTDYLAGLVGE